MSTGRILSVNTGSSSLKVALFVVGEAGPRAETRQEIEVDDGDQRHALGDALDRFTARSGAPAAVGHRVVHGGPRLSDPVLVDGDVLAELRRSVSFAPVHLPASIACIELVHERLPEVPQVACFDTAFHRTMPEVTRRFPLPDELWRAGIRRYGFHGLSYEYVVGALGPDLGARAVVAHLGNGSSLVALRDGVSIDTTMGFTPTGGVVMGTRSGDLDPGLIVHLLRVHGFDADGLEHLLDHESGLRALSHGTSDMKALLGAREHDARAALAIDVYCDRVRKAIGAFAAALGGLDTLVFTGGIGEHAAAIREQVCAGLGFLVADVRVVPTDEDLMIARHTADVVGAHARL